MESEVKRDYERRKPLTDSELTQIKTQLIESIYADIGKSVTKRILWLGGICILAFFAWLAAKGAIKLEL